MANVDLDDIRVAAPCTMDWNQMQGRGPIRHCGECQLSVFNLSAMTRPQAEAVVARHFEGERVCVRFYRRPDGTLLTQPGCPPGLAAARKAKWLVGAALSVMVGGLGFLVGLTLSSRVEGVLRRAAVALAPNPPVEREPEPEIYDDDFGDARHEMGALEDDLDN